MLLLIRSHSHIFGVTLSRTEAYSRKTLYILGLKEMRVVWVKKRPWSKKLFLYIYFTMNKGGLGKMVKKVINLTVGEVGVNILLFKGMQYIYFQTKVGVNILLLKGRRCIYFQTKGGRCKYFTF